jgi:hypothetical protein
MAWLVLKDLELFHGSPRLHRASKITLHAHRSRWISERNDERYAERERLDTPT